MSKKKRIDALVEENTREQLVEKAEAFGLIATGTKTEIAEQIVEAQGDQPTDGDTGDEGEGAIRSDGQRGINPQPAGLDPVDPAQLAPEEAAARSGVPGTVDVGAEKRAHAAAGRSQGKVPRMELRRASGEATPPVDE